MMNNRITCRYEKSSVSGGLASCLTARAVVLGMGKGRSLVLLWWMSCQVFVAVGQGLDASPSRDAAGSGAEHSANSGENLAGQLSRGIPRTFREAVARRVQMDEYASRVYKFSSIRGARAGRPEQRRRNPRHFVQVIRPSIPSSVLEYRRGLVATQNQVLGYRAPLFDVATEFRAPVLEREKLSAEEQAAAQLIRDSLAERGLLQTLANVLEVVGAERGVTRSAEVRRQLWQLGFPVDWLDYFSLSSKQDVTSENSDVIVGLARELAKDGDSSALRKRLESATFDFTATEPGFRGTVESGDHPIGLVRYQMGGSADQGILPGGSIDVATQLIRALSQTTFLVTVPEFAFENMQWMARFHWDLRRPEQLRLISDPAHFSGWAQDNGKPGYLDRGDGTPIWATLTPRYASRNEYPTELAPKESFLMDGLARTGHRVIQTPLLFQGGNLFLVREPRKDEKILLVGEADLYRNIELGLTRAQTIEAFRTEFAVDRCDVLPMVSFHLDFDLTCRVVDDRLVAFVNDSDAASRIILSLGLEAFGRAGLLKEDLVKSIQDELARGKTAMAINMLRGITRWLGKDEQNQARMVHSLFVKTTQDSARRNYQIFHNALDIAECLITNDFSDVQSSSKGSKAHLRNLRQLLEAQKSLAKELLGHGFEVVEVPSFPGIFASVNYLNGLHDERAYLIPAIGGFYSELDQKAARRFQKTIGVDAKVIPVLCSDLLLHNGALRCAASVYPQL